ncbi:MAG: aldo/keto reductase [Firmicutes bacterium]|nr:aldo/keto reductase [Bacillota bacterium]
MKYVKLGRTDLMVSQITFGCWQLEGGKWWELTSDENNIKTIQTAFANGINTFDTAEFYGDGHSEAVLGAALEGVRKDCIIASKVWPTHLKPDDVRRATETSLNHLKTDYLDIHYIHWPSKEVPVKDTLAVFNRLKEEKIIRAIGVSNFSLDQLKEAMEYARIDVIQPEYNLLKRYIEDDLLPFCRANQIGVTSYSSVAKGVLTGAFHFEQAKLRTDDFREGRRLFKPEHIAIEAELIYLMKEIADAKGVKISQIALSWVLHQSGMTSAIVGTQNAEHLLENIKSADIELTAEELARLDQTSAKVIKALED